MGKENKLLARMDFNGGKVRAHDIPNIHTFKR